MITYTGVGSRNTPGAVLALMRTIGLNLARHGFELRSGAASGADVAFEDGCCLYSTEAPRNIYIPWEGFNGRRTDKHTHVGASAAAMAVAAQFHPAWDKCSYGTKKLHARNMCQVLGIGLDSPSDFVVCWTPGGAGGGGTGQALRVAQHYNIPIFDLGKEDCLTALEGHLVQYPT